MPALFTDQDSRDQLCAGYPWQHPGYLTEYQRRTLARRAARRFLHGLVSAAVCLAVLVAVVLFVLVLAGVQG